MKQLLLPFLFLLAQGAAADQSAPDATARAPSSKSRPSLANQNSFWSLYYLFNRAARPTLPRDNSSFRTGPAELDLADPLHVVLLSLQLHVQSLDAPMADLQKHILRSAVTCAPDWPDNLGHAYIVLIQKRNRAWVLAARVGGNRFIVEDPQGIGLCVISAS